MRNLLEEFHHDHGIRPPTILGVREHVFTGRYYSESLFILNVTFDYFFDYLIYSYHLY